MASFASALRNPSSAFGSQIALSGNDDRCSTSAAATFFARPKFKGLEACRFRYPSAHFNFADRAWTTERSLDSFRVAAVIDRNGDLVFDSVESCASCAVVERAGLWLQAYSLSEAVQDRQTLDRWVRDHIVEIVKNVREAPFLQYIFDSKDTKTQRCTVSASSSECWNYVRESVADASPDGLILVRKLDGEAAQTVRDARSLPTSGQCAMQDDLCLKACTKGSSARKDLGGGGETSVDIWGVVVQGKGDVGSSCYILETTRAAIAGGASCTRFCLTRAQCFGPSLQAQMLLMWLHK